MVRKQREDTYPQTIRFPVDMDERIAAWAKHHGSVNAAVNKAVLEAVLAFEGEESTRVRVMRIDGKLPTIDEINAKLDELDRKFALLQSMGWAQLNALELTVNVGDATREWAEEFRKGR